MPDLTYLHFQMPVGNPGHSKQVGAIVVFRLTLLVLLITGTVNMPNQRN